MKYTPAHIWNGLKRRLFLDPQGYGRPIRKETLDREYSTGNWDHFFAYDELPRQLVLAGTVHHFFPDNPAVLDLGCGSGRLAQLFQKYPFSRYVGADISSEGIAKAKSLQLASVEFVEASFEDWQPEGQFDAITFNECIGYAADPAATLRAFVPHLTPGGLFFISHHRFGKSNSQWQRMEQVAETRTSTSVISSKGNIWDIKVLAPRTGKL